MGRWEAAGDWYDCALDLIHSKAKTNLDIDETFYQVVSHAILLDAALVELLRDNFMLSATLFSNAPAFRVEQHFGLGLLNMHLGMFQKADENFQRMLGIVNGDLHPSIRAAMAFCKCKCGKWEQAEALFEKAQAAGVLTVYAKVYLAFTKQKLGKYAQAEQLFDPLIQERILPGWALASLAFVKLQLQKTEEAQRISLQAIQASRERLPEEIWDYQDATDALANWFSAIVGMKLEAAVQEDQELFR